MVLEKLGKTLQDTLNKITKSSIVDKKLIAELVKDIQKALLQSDVNVQLVFKLTNEIKKRAETETTPATITKKEHLINIVYEELVRFIGSDAKELKVEKKPTTIMLVGLFGNGKTTTAGKLAKYFQTRAKKVAVIQTDTWRPAAYHQLKQLAEQLKVPFYGDLEIKDPAAIYNKYKEELQQYDVVIVDTAGRDALSDELVEELEHIHSTVNADEKLLVIGADVGQGAQKQAELFHNTCGVTGVIITKLDGTAKGGGALTACSITETPVRFIGVGEKVGDLEKFDPKRFVSRLLGMGDLEGLLEKAQAAFSEENAEDLAQRFMSGEFNLIDMHEQMSAMKKMGSMSKLMKLIPGMGKLNVPKDMMDSQEKNLEKWKFIMGSCTKKELAEPDIIDQSRAERIAEGSGTTVNDVREMLKQFKQSKKLVKMMKGGKVRQNKMMKNVMKQFGGQLPDFE